MAATAQSSSFLPRNLTSLTETVKFEFTLIRLFALESTLRFRQVACQVRQNRLEIDGRDNSFWLWEIRGEEKP